MLRSFPKSFRQGMLNTAAIAGISAMVLALWHVAGTTAGASAQRAPSPAAATASAATVARLADVPSHGERYRASLMPAATPIALGRSIAATLELRTAAGAPVEGAALVLESWMPEQEQVRGAQPHVTAELGGGRYRVEGLRFDRTGWWNVKLAITAPAGGDSLAFNVVF